jgi:hypothetical protein
LTYMVSAARLIFSGVLGSIPDLKVRLLRGRHRLGSLANAHTERAHAQ